MGDRPLRVLLVEDDEDDYLLTRDLLEAAGAARFHLEWESDYEAALEAMGACRHDVYLVDYRLGGRDGLELLREALACGCTAPLILLTGQGDREVDVAATRAGATDYLIKGTIDAERLERSIRYALERKRTEEDLRRARAELEGRVRERTEELRRRVEELDRAREAAEAASRAKDTFLAVVSHELRTPLTPVMLGVGAMLERAGLEPDLRDLLRMVEQNLTAEARLIDDLLDVTRIVHGEMDYRMEAVDVHVLGARALRAYASQFKAAGLERIEELGARNAWVHGDAARLGQVLRNLIANAVKFTPAGGRVTIATRDDGPRLVVCIRDTGIGIDAATLPTIFQAFEQGERTAIRRYGGLGLGLAICRSIVEAHGGRLTASSAATGRGAEFTVELKAIAKVAVPRAARGAAAGIHGGAALRIFYVEDDAMTARVFRKLLLMEGYEVRHAATYGEAIEAADGAFDLVLSDIALPDGSGWDVMRHIRSRWGNIPGIAVSGFGAAEDREASREAGFATHLTKPVQFQDLREAIAQVSRPPGPP